VSRFFAIRPAAELLYYSMKRALSAYAASSLGSYSCPMLHKVTYRKKQDVTLADGGVIPKAVPNLCLGLVYKAETPITLRPQSWNYI
jgi:hypothetical protein